MTEPDSLSRQHYFMIVATRIAGAAGAAFGVVLLGRAHTLGPQILGVAIVLSAMTMMALVPRSLAARWRTPPQP
ncbi:hypothetical protein [Sphingomonas sp. 28-63-12]|uniref:hypothetical protein n=1 Tax=Sphingomonas sp. 28-63-12 TaxID=1970434 RepID=UPI000BD2820E|nr:MAG: hypothetical protein B7Y47_11675 [Sphingomonas sp. 28-63-12]